MKHLSLLTMALCALVSTSFAQYTLTVDTATAVDPALGTTYRFYVNLEDATDQISAITATTKVPCQWMHQTEYSTVHLTRHGMHQESTQHF